MNNNFTLDFQECCWKPNIKYHGWIVPVHAQPFNSVSIDFIPFKLFTLFNNHLTIQLKLIRVLVESMFGKTLILFGKLVIKIVKFFSILIYGLSKVNKTRIIKAKPLFERLGEQSLETRKRDTISIHKL